MSKEEDKFWAKRGARNKATGTHVPKRRPDSWWDKQEEKSEKQKRTTKK